MILYHVFLITVFLVSKPLKVAASPEIFSAVISDMACSLSLTLEAEKVDIAKSSVQCITNQAVSVESVKVVNDDTDHIFQLKLTADSEKTKLISASVLANAKRPVDDEVGLKNVAKRGRRIGAKTKPDISAICTYQDPNDVDWNPCQETGIRSKALNLIAESEPMACLRYRTMSEKCKGGTREYKQSVSIRARGPPAAAKGDNKTEPEQETGLRNRAGSSGTVNISTNTVYATIQWKGRWGSFPSSPKFCPDGSFVYGYRLRSEGSQDKGDDTAINDIELYCRRPNSYTVTRKIWSDYRTWGSWSSDAFCPGNDNPVVGFDVREEGSQGNGDDTAINDVDLYCNNGGRYISAPVKTTWGSWKPVLRCPSGQAVVGILTQVEPSQGGGDDTALNGLKLYCKPYTAVNQKCDTGNLPTIENASVNCEKGRDYRKGETCKVKCNNGYEHENNFYIVTCWSYGVWKKFSTKCVTQKCDTGNLPTIENASVNCEEGRVYRKSETCKVKCNNGYKHENNFYIVTCWSYGVWKKFSTKCVPI